MSSKATHSNDRNSPSQDHSEIWQDDTLDRKSDAILLRNFLLERASERGNRGRSKTYVMNIDAAWGNGKTFFMKRFASMLKCDGYCVSYIDAWSDDHAEDPMLSVIYNIDETMKPILSNRKKLQRRWEIVKHSGIAITAAAASGAVKQLGSRIIGGAVDEISEIITGKADVDTTKFDQSISDALVD